MKLRALASESGVSTASIKYYIHSGILRPGRKKNATTAVYDDEHLHRLALIRWLREELDTPISGIAELTSAIDDESFSTLELMGMCQELALRGNSGLPSSALRAPASGPNSFGRDSASEADAGAGSNPPPQQFVDLVSAAVDRLGWPDEVSAARNALARVLADVDAAGYSVSVDSVVTQCRAITAVAQNNIRPISGDLSRDEVCLRTIRGITMHNRQLIATSALTHASLSILSRGFDD